MLEHPELIQCFFCNDICYAHYCRVYEYSRNKRHVYVCMQCNNAINRMGAMQLVYNQESKIGKMVIDNDAIHQRISDMMNAENELMKRVSKLKREVMSLPYM